MNSAIFLKSSRRKLLPLIFLCLSNEAKAGELALPVKYPSIEDFLTQEDESQRYGGERSSLEGLIISDLKEVREKSFMSLLKNTPRDSLETFVLQNSPFGLVSLKTSLGENSLAWHLGDTLSQCYQLEKLVLRNIGLDTRVLLEMFGGRKFFSLQELDISLNPHLINEHTQSPFNVSWALSTLLSSPESFPNLRVLNLSDCNLPQAIIKEIIEGFDLHPSLQTLYISHNKIGKEEIKRLQSPSFKSDLEKGIVEKKKPSQKNPLKMTFSEFQKKSKNVKIGTKQEKVGEVEIFTKQGITENLIPSSFIFKESIFHEGEEYTLKEIKRLIEKCYWDPKENNSKKMNVLQEELSKKAHAFYEFYKDTLSPEQAGDLFKIMLFYHSQALNNIFYPKLVEILDFLTQKAGKETVEAYKEIDDFFKGHSKKIIEIMNEMGESAESYQEACFLYLKEAYKTPGLKEGLENDCPISLFQESYRALIDEQNFMNVGHTPYNPKKTIRFLEATLYFLGEEGKKVYIPHYHVNVMYLTLLTALDYISPSDLSFFLKSIDLDSFYSCLPKENVQQLKRKIHDSSESEKNTASLTQEKLKTLILSDESYDDEQKNSIREALKEVFQEFSERNN